MVNHRSFTRFGFSAGPRVALNPTKTVYDFIELRSGYVRAIKQVNYTHLLHGQIIRGHKTECTSARVSEDQQERSGM